MGELNTELSWNKIISKLKSLGAVITVPKDFHSRIEKINDILDEDKTGLVSTIYEFMVGSATVDYNIVTSNTTLTNILTDWANNKLNQDINIDIPSGLRELSSQYFRERWSSSFIVLKILWSRIGNFILPSKMFFLDGGNVFVKSNSDLRAKKYFLGESKNALVSTETETVIIRKPYNKWYDAYPTPYFVKKGILFNSLLKQELVQKQADILEEIIPYLLLLKAGDKDLLQYNGLTGLEEKLGTLKESLLKYKRDHQYRATAGDSIFRGRYDLQLEHFMPELGKVFDEKIGRPIDNNILAGFGMIDLQGFGDSREESIMNPRMLIEEIVDGVLDLTTIYEYVFSLIIEKNKVLHRNQMKKDIRIIPGVIKAVLTDSMRKLIKDYSNTGQLSLEDSFEALPLGFDFEVNVMRRRQEREKDYEELMFPRVLLNQDANLRQDVPTRQGVTPNEIPKKKQTEKAEQEDTYKCVKCGQDFDLTKTVEKGMDYTICPHCNEGLTDKDMVKAEQENIQAPYETIDDLPENVKNPLPVGGQLLWLSVFNAILKETNNEETARKGAWAKVKEKYYKPDNEDKWRKRKTN